MKYFASILFLAIIFSCDKKNQSSETQNNSSTLGDISLDVTGSENAKVYFKKGLLLLHSFEFNDAAEAFIQAQNEDPSLAMAYWGEAMTYNHPLWRQQNYEKGVEALTKLKTRQIPPLEPLESDFIQATIILYGEGDKFERDIAYSQYMEALYNKYPGHHEVAAFYALSLLGTIHIGRDDEVFDKGARIVQSILDENPNHPGALHYLIHSYDDPENAYKALEAANSYSVVAKDASHALHMPSHIYVALGMWDNVVLSNVDSWEASVARMKRKSLNNNAQSYHALYWLMYGYLQQGKYTEATQIMTDMERYTSELPSYGARDYITNMKGTYLTETNDWSSKFLDIDVDQEDLRVSVQGVQLFTMGMKSFKEKDQDGITSALSSMIEIRTFAETRVSKTGAPLCGAGQRRSDPNQLDIDQLHVMELEVAALLAMSNEDPANAKLKLDEATRLEENISYSYGPPSIVKPSHELYADWLLSNDKPDKAITMYKKALKRGPKRIKSLSGLLECAKRTDNSELEMETEKELKEILHNADFSIDDMNSRTI